MNTTKNTNGKTNIFEIGKNVLTKNQKSKKSIYKSELFAECKTDKEKKHLRIKLRRQLKYFINSFAEYSAKKDTNKIAELKKAWQEYAKAVYINTSIIIEGNANDDLQKDVKTFLKAFEK